MISSNLSKLQRWIVLAIVSSALFMIVIDMTVLYSVLPRLTHDLAASASEKLWIVNIYPLVMAGLLLGLGTLGDRLGHKTLCYGTYYLWVGFINRCLRADTSRAYCCAYPTSYWCSYDDARNTLHYSNYLFG